MLVVINTINMQKLIALLICADNYMLVLQTNSMFVVTNSVDACYRCWNSLLLIHVVNDMHVMQSLI